MGESIILLMLGTVVEAGSGGSRECCLIYLLFNKNFLFRSKRMHNGVTVTETGSQSVWMATAFLKLFVPHL